MTVYSDWSVMCGDLRFRFCTGCISMMQNNFDDALVACRADDSYNIAIDW